MTGPTIVWEGSFLTNMSLAAVNRAVCRELSRQGVDLGIVAYERESDPPCVDDVEWLQPLMDRKASVPPRVIVRHRYPPDFTPAPGSKLVAIQPWEYSSVPRDWVAGINATVDELWVPSDYVRRVFVTDGVAAARVFALPNGFDPATFHPNVLPYDLPTRKRFRFLYVGSWIHRKGADLLVRAYSEEFSAADDVCLVVKDHAFYGRRIPDAHPFPRRAAAPEIIYRCDNVSAAEMAALYAASSCLVHPFRAEGFGLPILEAMACGRPIIATDAGPVREFAPPDAGLFLAGRIMHMTGVDEFETVRAPGFVETTVDILRAAMRHAYTHAEDFAQAGAAAAAYVHERFTWATVARRYVGRLTAVAPGGALDRAMVALKADRIADAVPIFADLIEQDPTNLAALIGAAHCAVATDDRRTARVLLRRILHLDPRNEHARAALNRLG